SRVFSTLICSRMSAISSAGCRLVIAVKAFGPMSIGLFSLLLFAVFRVQRADCPWSAAFDRFLVASPPVRDLLLFANYLFVAAEIVWHAHKSLIRGIVAAHHFVLGTSQEGPAMASANKYLAHLNKSTDVI